MHKESVQVCRKLAGVDQKDCSFWLKMLYRYAMCTISVVLQKKLADSFIEGRKRVHANMAHITALRHYDVDKVIEYNEIQMENGIYDDLD